MKLSNFFIFTILILGIALGFVIGKSVLPSKSDILSTLFSYPNGSTCEHPCILGIQPGLTTPNQAIELMKTHPFTKGNAIRQSQYKNSAANQSQYKGQYYVNVALDKNSLSMKVDYITNQVLEVGLISEGINGLGFIGINIGGMDVRWEDALSYLGSPEVVAVSGGDGGMIFLAAGLYDDGWCIHAYPSDSYSQPPLILSDSRIIRIELNCHLLKDLDD